ncbi:MAG: glutathione S-transferase family protein [Solirubrobacteraceae bacterium]
MKLITIPFSHFCEKARWGLDRAGLAYTEKGYAPVVHRLAVTARGSTTAPVLVHGRRTVRGSSAILEHCDAIGHAPDPLYPQDPATRREVEELVARFDERLGPTTRLWLYAWAVEDRERLMRFSSRGLAPGQRRRLQRVLPVVQRVLRVAMQIGPHAQERSARAADEELAFVSQRLSDGRPYLAGDGFTAADLTFAALASPVLMPPGYGGGAVPPATPPPELADAVARWRDTPAGRHGTAMYRDRPVPA